jgi:hypothetical protein
VNYLQRFVCALAIEALLGLVIWALLLLLGAEPIK